MLCKAMTSLFLPRQRKTAPIASAGKPFQASVRSAMIGHRCGLPSVNADKDAARTHIPSTDFCRHGLRNAASAATAGTAKATAPNPKARHLAIKLRRASGEAESGLGTLESTAVKSE